jgi:antitoxin ParD1/3/4
MASVEKVSVALTNEQVSALTAALETGEYATTSEIVREALRDWQLKRELRQEDIKRLRQMWDAGVASGSAGELDMKKLREDARARLESRKKTAGDAD